MSTKPLTTSLITRRDFLSHSWNGIGALGLAGLLADELNGSTPLAPTNPLIPKAQHMPRKAKHCIFLFMQGGVSQMDSFEYKPRLRELHGKPIPSGQSVTGELQGRLSFPHACVGSPFDFKQHGDSGRWLSELFPHLAKRVDDLAFIHGIKTDNQNHGPSTYHVTTGSQFPGSPSVGSWIQYGLGTVNQNMPGYIVIQDPRGAPCNGAAVWANGYLPAVHQGTLLRDQGTPILNLARAQNLSQSDQRSEFDTIRHLNQQHLKHRLGDTELESRIAAYELAFRMQTEAPDAVDLSSEPKSIRKLYGLDNERTAGFGRQCLLARRMVERGVRHSLLIHGVQIGSHSWDDHGNVEGGMQKHSAEVDQPVAALLEDLDRRGLLEETLVVWASEMGRTPFVNNPQLPKNPGREHNSYGLCMWMAGGNIKGGATAGATDDFSLRSVEEPIHIRDIHATILHLMGLDDERLIFHHAGRIRKLTDIGGNPLQGIIA
ncbi:MAG: DUF1501 domain-containing protein [Verrucomicrobia bacterium]|jgi:hypothetical protein|nr:DUF1501 domain-containing protein [Verrucomicrobiota bacterium]